MGDIKNHIVSKQRNEEGIVNFLFNLQTNFFYISIIYPILLTILHYMNQDQQHTPKKDNNHTNVSPNTMKSEIQLKRDKKKKLSAFKTFLDNASDSIQPQEPGLKKKISSSVVFQQSVQPFNSCKVCKQYLTNQSKICQFCNDTVCTIHFRKRRRNIKTNKWTKICDHCEDRHLMQRYCLNQIKTEESLISEELILQRRHGEFRQILSNKKLQLQMSQNKQVQLASTYSHEMARMKAQKAQLESKINESQNGITENRKLELFLIDLQKKLPPSLQQDFQYLQGQNYRISRDLVKYERLCNDIIAARSKKEKDMYREYYEWQNKKRRQLDENQPESGECNII